MCSFTTLQVPRLYHFGTVYKKSSIRKVFRGLNLNSLPVHLTQNGHMGYNKKPEEKKRLATPEVHNKAETVIFLTA
jgi:hypothetical protein